MTTAQQIENLLKFLPNTRSSDTELLLAYMQKAGMGLTARQVEKFKNLPTPETLTRIRRKEAKKYGISSVDIDKFWTNITIEQDCWVWKNAKTGSGYGAFYDSVSGKTLLAHRLSLMLSGEELKSGLQVDHLCRNRKCVNPDHLEQVSPRENVLRGVGHASRNAKKTHCVNGHEFTDKNTRIRKTDNARACRRCATLLQRRVRERKRLESAN